jgi:hypothetical protein
LIDRYLAKSGYKGQLTDEPVRADAPRNLFEPVAGDFGAHGRFDEEARQQSWEMFTNRHRTVFWAMAGIGALSLVRALLQKRD